MQGDREEGDGFGRGLDGRLLGPLRNPEHIWTVKYDEATAGGFNLAMMALHYSSQLTWNFDAQPWNGYSTLEEFYNSFEDVFGMVAILKTLLN